MPHQRQVVVQPQTARQLAYQAKKLCNEALRDKDKEKFAKALEYSRQALALEPRNCSIMNGYADILRKMGEPNQAIEKFDGVLRLKSRNVYAVAGKGLAYEDLKQTRQAMQMYRKALDIDPDNSDVYEYKCTLEKKMQTASSSVAANPHAFHGRRQPAVSSKVELVSEGRFDLLRKCNTR